MARTSQPWKVLVSEKRTFLEVGLIECQDCDSQRHCTEQVHSGCSILCRSHSEPDLLRGSSRIQDRHFLIEFPARCSPEKDVSTSRTESVSNVIDEPLPMKTGLDSETPTADETSLQALSERLRKLAEALMQTASTMTTSETVAPSAAPAPDGISPGSACPLSLVNVVAEAAAQAQDVARQFQRSAEPGKDGQDSMRAHLLELKDEDHDCVFIVRKFHKLGGSARSLLTKHFSQYGEVAHVFLHGSRTEAQGAKPMRAGDSGFIVMKSTDAVTRILAKGGKETIGRCQIRVQKFETEVDDRSVMSEAFAKHSVMIQSGEACVQRFSKQERICCDDAKALTAQ